MIYKCKMCGGNLSIDDNSNVVVCEYCGTKQTFPRVDSERVANIYDRANFLRRSNDFDRASGLYEQILSENKEDAEAYWSLVLCRYGIEYVEDPASKKRIPTINRVQFESILNDENYSNALKYAEEDARVLYKKEAEYIDSVQKEILSISSKEEPYDIFICYKETDNNGNRTADSVLAQDIYNNLTDKGYKVFFSRITLEDKLGVAYEPYIFAALNSAKVMLVTGTSKENINSVWVKNEWSRYLSLISKDRSKNLIPLYRDMSPYDLPEEFSYLQGQDMSKIGFMQDLIRGIEKIIHISDSKKTINDINTAPLFERAYMHLEDGDWKSAETYFEKALDFNPKNGEAYLGKLMAELHIRTRKELEECTLPFYNKDNFEKALRFGDEALKSELSEYKNNRIYNNALALMKAAGSPKDYEEASSLFRLISGFKDADNLLYSCNEKAEEKRSANKKAAKKLKMIFVVVAAVVCVCIACVYIIINSKYNSAMDLYNNGNYSEAYSIFSTLNYKDSEDKALGCIYGEAMDLYNNGNYSEAYSIFSTLNYKDSADKASECIYYEQASKLKDISAGDIIAFGYYEQDNNTENGNEEIEWRVLAVENNKALIISEYGLDCSQYNTSLTDTVWKECALRFWLNNEFLNEAFSSKHQELIESTNVSADRNPYYNTDPGYKTTDKVFLLSINQVNEYFGSDEDRKCIPTDYAVANGAHASAIYSKDGSATCHWWLRSPGEYVNRAARVDDDGSVLNSGSAVNFEDICVRPALWINFES